MLGTFLSATQPGCFCGHSPFIPTQFSHLLWCLLPDCSDAQPSLIRILPALKGRTFESLRENPKRALDKKYSNLSVICR